MEQKDFFVAVHSITYNHAAYIIDAMNGFCMQETTFPFVCIIVDDASNDGEQDVIRNYLREHFSVESTDALTEEADDYILSFAQHKANKNCFFAVYYLKYNYHQIKKSKSDFFRRWNNMAKYIALCEGDDYWIDPQKLQTKVDFLDSHPDYTMTCNRAKLFSVRQNKYIGENYCYKKSQVVDPKDIINRTGLFISTCSIVFRPEVRDNYPDYCVKCKVGDYPLQIMCAMKGKVYYFNDIMSVYRVQNSRSWMGQQKWGRIDEERLAVIKSQIDMFNGFKCDFPLYAKVLKNKMANHINRNFPYSDNCLDAKNSYLRYFEEEIKEYSIRWKIDLQMRMCRIPKVRGLYTRLFLGKYNQRRILY